jgi:hypothetical protein
MSEIAQKSRYLDFTKSSKLDNEDKKENYHICIDLAIMLLTAVIKETLRNMESNRLVTLLCIF